jgi:hypothetical protein
MANLTDFFPAPASNNILEMLSAPADGRTVTVSSGSYTMENLTATQAMSTSFADITCSSIAYKPPAGAKWVHYRFDFQYRAHTNSGIFGGRLLYDGTVVTTASRGMATNYSNGGSSQGNFPGFIEQVFDLTVSTTNIAAGQIAASDWTSNKTIKVQGREYASSYQVILHQNLYEDGAGASGDEVFTKPILTITSYS